MKSEEFEEIEEQQEEVEVENPVFTNPGASKNRMFRVFQY
jgi:hypothetical protein